MKKNDKNISEIYLRFLGKKWRNSKCSNFCVFQSYELRFWEEICLFIIRSFPGSFVFGLISGEGYPPPLLTYTKKILPKIIQIFIFWTSLLLIYNENFRGKHFGFSKLWAHIFRDVLSLSNSFISSIFCVKVSSQETVPPPLLTQ